MKVLRYGEKIIGAGATESAQRCSAENCTEPSTFHIDFRGSSKRTVEFCAAHLRDARVGDVEFDRAMSEFVQKSESKAAATNLGS